MFPVGSRRRFTMLWGLMLVLVWAAASSDQAGAQPLGAVATQRVHHQLLPKDTIYFDSFAPLTGSVAGELRAMGYAIEDQGWEMGDVQAVRVTEKRVEVASDPRGRGVGIVVWETGNRRR